MTLNTLDPAIIERIEHELRHYRRWKARLAEITAELADVPGPRRGLADRRIQQGHGDPTAAIAQSRDRLWRERARLRRRVQRIEHVVRALPPQHRRLVQLWYFEGRSSHQVACRLHVGRATVWRMRREALEIYAQVACVFTGRNAG